MIFLDRAIFMLIQLFFAIATIWLSTYSFLMYVIVKTRIFERVFEMAKSLVLAEKPSVARDIANVLKCHKKGNGFLEGDKYIVTWALGHLVTLADPESYDEKYKKVEFRRLTDAARASKAYDNSTNKQAI